MDIHVEIYDENKTYQTLSKEIYQRSKHMSKIVNISELTGSLRLKLNSKVTREEWGYIIRLSELIPKGKFNDKKASRGAKLSNETIKFLSNVEMNTLIRLSNITSARELQFNDIHIAISKYISATISNKSLENIRKLLNIENDINPSIRMFNSNNNNVKV